MIRRAAALVFALTLSACQPAPVEPPPPGQIDRKGTVLKTVNGQAVTQDMLDAMIKQLPEQLRAQLEATGQMSQMQEQLVIQEILYQKAVAAKIYNEPEIAAALAVTTRSTLADAMLRREMDSRVNDAAIQKWYDEHAVQFARPQVQLAHVMVATEDEAKAIKAQLDGGADFAAVAAEKSLDTRTSKEGGVIGWVRPKDIGPLGAAVEGQAKGTLAGPVKSTNAWHVLKIMDTREKVPLEEVKEQISEQVKQDAADAYIQEIKTAATIVDGAGGATVTPAGGTPAGGTPAGAGSPPAAPAEGAPGEAGK